MSSAGFQLLTTRFPSTPPRITLPMPLLTDHATRNPITVADFDTAFARGHPSINAQQQQQQQQQQQHPPPPPKKKKQKQQQPETERQGTRKE
jgi:hypothetical protein